MGDYVSARRGACKNKLGERGHDWEIKGPDGTTTAEVYWRWLEISRDTYQVKILNPRAIEPYFVLTNVFGNPADRSNLA